MTLGELLASDRLVRDPRCPFAGVCREQLPAVIARQKVALRQMVGETKAELAKQIKGLEELAAELNDRQRQLFPA